MSIVAWHKALLAVKCHSLVTPYRGTVLVLHSDLSLQDFSHTNNIFSTIQVLWKLCQNQNIKF